MVFKNSPCPGVVQLVFISLSLFDFPICIFKLYILLKGDLVECDCDVVGVRTGG